ncbi:MAG: SDR family oxidoreductase [Verrucomicrobia bacterium]|nr:MAG: SDR family oxidoreductase [Verrucomicrobiota bacterium]
MSARNNLPFGPAGWTPERLGDLTGRTYLITGANSGTGFQAARLLLAHGARVVMLNRNPEKSAAAIASLKAERGPEADVTAIQLDLASLASVREAAAQVRQRLSHIDALICNAAIAQVANRTLTVDGFESQFAVNHLGHFLLCGLLFDRIEASGGRIVVVGSNAYRMGLKRIKFEDIHFAENYSAWDAYAQSKLAQLMFAFELQRRLAAAGCDTRAYACHPGASRTNLLRDTASPFTRLLWGTLAVFIAQSAERGAWPEVLCATEPGLKPATLYGPTRRGEMVGPVGECRLQPHVLDTSAAARLWKLSEAMTGLAWSP